MDKKRKAWCEKYQVKMADGGFIEKYCAPEHVERMANSYPMTGFTYIGWDGRATTWEGLTEEEKQDFEERIKDNDLAKLIHHIAEEQDKGKNYRERTRRIKNICYAEQEKYPQLL